MNWDAILGWTFASASMLCLLVWLAYELTHAPDEPEYEPSPGYADLIEARARQEARQAYDVVDLLADDECPLGDIALDADGLLMSVEVLADIDDYPETDPDFIAEYESRN